MPSVLILGAASDMAVAIARKFASEKYDVIVAGRDTEFLATLKNDIAIRFNVKAEAAKFDATDYASHQSFYQDLSFHPDVSICVFGYMGDEPNTITNWNEVSRIIDTNYKGAASVLNIIATDYAVKNNGTIVGISSVAGIRGRQSNFIYGSAKAALTAYLAGLRNLMYKSNVHVISVLPGFVYTKMTANLKLPKPLTATPEEVASVIFTAVKKKKNIVYVKWFWRWIMLIIKSIPETVFKKMKL